MLFEGSEKKIKQYLEIPGEPQKGHGEISLLELSFIFLSVILLIPYEMTGSALGLKIYGCLNLFCDFVFVGFLFRLKKPPEQRASGFFPVLTDILLALPGILALLILLFWAFITGHFHLGEYIAGSGLALPFLKTYGLLRLSRSLQMLRLVRIIKLLWFVRLKVNSSSVKTSMGWLGFCFLVILVLINLLFVFQGPLSIKENYYYNRLNYLKAVLEQNPNKDLTDVFSRVFYSNLKDRLVYIKINNAKQYYNEYSRISPSEVESRISRDLCFLNSTKITVRDIEVLFNDREFFAEKRTENMLWTIAIIFAVILFTISASGIMGGSRTVLTQDDVQAMFDSYAGVQSTPAGDQEIPGQEQKGPFTCALGLFIQDFARLRNAVHELELMLETKDSKIRELYNTIKEMEQKGEDASAGHDMVKMDEIRKDLERSVEIIRKLCSKQPEVLEKIRKNYPLRTIPI